MSRNGLSVARVVVILGLAIQILGLARLIFLEVGLARWIASVQNGFGPSIAASAVILACLALLYPAGRGRRWALVTTVPVQLLLTWTGIPFFIDEFPKPAGGFVDWLTFTTLFITGVVAAAWGLTSYSKWPKTMRTPLVLVWLGALQLTLPNWFHVGLHESSINLEDFFTPLLFIDYAFHVPWLIFAGLLFIAIRQIASAPPAQKTEAGQP